MERVWSQSFSPCNLSLYATYNLNSRQKQFSLICLPPRGLSHRGQNSHHPESQRRLGSRRRQGNWFGVRSRKFRVGSWVAFQSQSQSPPGQRACPASSSDTVLLVCLWHIHCMLPRRGLRQHCAVKKSPFLAVFS